jgi:rod shape determining protein RodA
MSFGSTGSDRLRQPKARGAGGLPPIRTGGRSWGGPALTRPPSLGERLLAREAPLRNLDWLLLVVVLALSLLGTLLVWSATDPGLAHAGADPYAYLKKQLLNTAIGLVLMIAVALIDARQLRVLAPVVYLAGLVGLLAVLSPLGSTINGAHAWISLPGGFQIEPSEYAKLGLILMIAMLFSEAREGRRRPRLRDAALVLACAAPVLGLVIAEPALGVTIVLALITVGMIALSGLRLRWLAVMAGGGGLAAAAVLGLHLLRPYQVQRLAAFANPSADPLGTGYSAAQAKIAIGSGGMFGQGLFHGQLVAGNFVPSQQTDFIFTVAGEELGFAGCIAIIVLLGLLLLRALRIAARAEDQFGLLVASGIAIWFAFQSFINIGMTIGIMPVTGLPLPFVSYGGSAMFADMIAVGVLQSVRRRHSVFG